MMDQAITVGQVVAAFGGLFIVGIVFASVMFALWFMAQGWDH